MHGFNKPKKTTLKALLTWRNSAGEVNISELVDGSFIVSNAPCIVWWKPFQKMAWVIYQKDKPGPIDPWRTKNCSNGY